MINSNPARVLAESNRQLARQLQSMSFGPTGEVDFWSKQAKRIAFEAASHAALDTLSVRAGEQDAADVETANLEGIRQANQSYQRTATDIAFNGYGETDYWSKRTKNLALAAAANACTVAARCDGPAAAAARPMVEQAMARAESLAFDGYGEVSYWSARAKSLAHLPPPVDPAALPAPSGSAPPTAAPLGPQLDRLNQTYLKNLDTLAFDQYGDTDVWSKAAKLITFRAADHGALVAMVAAAAQPAVAAEQADHLDDVDRQIAEYASQAKDVAWNGYGDQGYWSRRAKSFAVDTAVRVGSLAARCDSEQMATAAPYLTKALADAQTCGFDGYGDIDYWSQRTKQMCGDLVASFQEMAADLRAQHAASQAAPLTPEEAKDPQAVERRRLEVEIARNHAVQEAADREAAAQSGDLAQVQGSLNQVIQKMNPLVEQDQKWVRQINVSRFGLMGGGLATIATMSSLSGGNPIVTAVCLGGMAVAVASGVINFRARGRHAQVMALWSPLHDTSESLERRQQSLSKAVGRAHGRSEDAAAKMQAAQGRLDVLRAWPTR